MRLDQRIPDLSDSELENLHANAVRLAQSGSAGQRQHAEELLPLLGAELEKRRSLHAEARAASRRTTVRNKAVSGRATKGRSDGTPSKTH